MESAELISTLDPRALLNCDFARRYLYHADGDEAHQANVRVVRLDEDKGPCGNDTEVGLGSSEDGVVVAQGRGERIIGTRNDTGLDYCASDGAVPAVVVGGREESLIDCAAVESRGKWVAIEHVP